MFGFDYASGASLHYLEKRGDRAIPDIRAAFSRDKEFDPIKTGIVSVLGNIQTPAAFELLLGLLRHESPHIVNWAGNALGKFENVEALPAMVAASERIGGEQMIEAAIRRLRDLEKPTSPAAA
jgi:HEAT repeat protein